MFASYRLGGDKEWLTPLFKPAYQTGRRASRGVCGDKEAFSFKINEEMAK